MDNFILSAFADEIDMDLKTQMDVLEQHGIKYIEMRGVNGKNIAEVTISEAEEIKKQLDRRGFKLSALGSPIGKIKITDDFEPHLQTFKHLLELAKILNTKYIRMFSFFIPKGEDANRYKNEVVRRWKAFLEAAKNYDIILLHENEKNIYGDTPERCVELFEALNSDQVKLIFDPANFIQCDVETYPKAFDLMKEHVAYFHIKDALLKNHEVVPVGYGDGCVEAILKEAKERGFKGFLSLEPHLGNFKGFSELEQGELQEDIEESGPGRFAVAVNALKALLGRL